MLSAPESDKGWQRVEVVHGITVWQRPVEGSSLVEFRGRAVIAAPMVNILAVIRGADRQREWMANCTQSRLLSRQGPVDGHVYGRLQPSVFASERDFVLASRLTRLPQERSMRLDFQQIRDDRAPEVEGVVRMQLLQGFFLLHEVDAGHTEVTYQVRSDPGGSLPTALVNLAALDFPRDTLAGLREQVTKSGYDGDLVELNAHIDWTGFAGHPQ